MTSLFVPAPTSAAPPGQHAQPSRLRLLDNLPSPAGYDPHHLPLLRPPLAHRLASPRLLPASSQQPPPFSCVALCLANRHSRLMLGCRRSCSHCSCSPRPPELVRVVQSVLVPFSTACEARMASLALTSQQQSRWPGRPSASRAAHPRAKCQPSRSCWPPSRRIWKNQRSHHSAYRCWGPDLR